MVKVERCGCVVLGIGELGGGKPEEGGGVSKRSSVVSWDVSKPAVMLMRVVGERRRVREVVR